MTLDRVRRTIHLINLLQAERGATADCLAAALGCSRRTIYRDIKTLNESGINVFFDDRLGGYTTDPRTAIPPLPIDDDEFVAVLVAAAVSFLSTIRPFSQSVEQGLAKLMAQATPQVRNRVNNLLNSIVPEDTVSRIVPAQHGVYQEVIRAMEAREQVRLHWQEKGGEGSLYAKVAPYQLEAAASGWSILGRSSFHRRVIRVDMNDIVSAERTGDTYTVPPSHLGANRRRRLKTLGSQKIR